eukprot:4590387-Pleurochrysis_carterae.AAC.1
MHAQLSAHWSLLDVVQPSLGRLHPIFVMLRKLIRQGGAVAMRFARRFMCNCALGSDSPPVKKLVRARHFFRQCPCASGSRRSLLCIPHRSLLVNRA